MLGSCKQGRPRMAWVDNINTLTGLSMEESVRMIRGQRYMEKVQKYVRGVANP